MTVDIDIVLRAGALNGECPVWSAQREVLFWVDLREPALHAFDPLAGTDRAWHMPAWIGCYGLTEDDTTVDDPMGGGALVALRTGLFHLHLKTGSLRFIASAPFDTRRFIFNDGRCDPRGRFLAGTMYSPLPPGNETQGGPQAMPLFRRHADGSWVPMTPPVRTSNGLAFSPDGRRMYHSDTEARTIWVWDYAPESGEPGNRRVFAKLDDLPPDVGPDGAAVDSDGFYWCAVFGAGVLHRYDPDGRLEREVRMPVQYPTMPAFGGPDLTTLFVTSATWPLSSQDRSRHPDEGALMALAAPVPGLPEPFADLTGIGASS